MKLHSPLFERALRRSVKTIVRRSPELKRAAKRGRLRRHFQLKVVVRPLASVFLAFVVWNSFETTQHVAGSLAVLSIWAFALAFFRASNLLNCLFNSNDLSALVCLPVETKTVFRWQRQKFNLNSIYSFIDLAAGFSVLGVICKFSYLQWSLLPALTLAAGASLAAIAALLVTRASALTRIAVASMTGLWFIIFLIGRFVPWEKVWRLLDGQSAWINALLPTGWIISLFELLLPEKNWMQLVFIFPAGFLIWSLKDSFAKLRKDYEFREITVPVSPDIIPRHEREDVPASGIDATRRHLGVSEIEQIVQTRQFFVKTLWHKRGWLERRLWNWLTPRERVLAEFAFDDGLSMSRAWKKILRNVLIAVGAGFVVGFASPVLRIWIIGFGLFVTTCQVLAQILLTGRAFTKVFCSGVNIPIYAAYAVGYREFSRLLFKCTAIQLFFVIPFSMVATAIIVHLSGITGVAHLAVIVLGFKIGCLLAATRFPMVTFAFSSGTNDSSRFKLSTLVLLGAFIGLGMLFLGLGGAGLFVPNTGTAWTLFVFALLDAYALFRIYGWFYHAKSFDLMNLPR